MTDLKKELEEQLKKVIHRLQILDMIEEKLLQMRELAQRVIDEELTDKKIKGVNLHVKSLEEQVRLLNSESTELS